MKIKNLLHRGAMAFTIAAIMSCMRSEAAPSAEAAAVPVDFSEVYNPNIPSKLSLCGQTFDLDVTDYYERFDRELTSLIYTHGNTLLTIKRANRYFPQIAPVLRQNGMPEDLLYLACVESTLNPRAVSGAKAAGIWQFMPSTAREYGLEVTDEVDERFNIEKATNAACRYFKSALSRYNGDWASVMASYNAGMGRISGQLSAQNAETALDLYLVDETQRYPFRILAMKAILEQPSVFGFRLSADQLYQPRQVRIVEVSGPVESWAAWAREQGITYNVLRDENPWIRDSKLTNKAGKTYKVRVPEKESLRRSTSPRQVYNKAWIAR